MSEQLNLKIMNCPTCGAKLKVKEKNEVVTCVYCGNSIVPVVEVTPAVQGENVTGVNGVLKVEGIKTSSSALAYVELFFEEYDWEAFAYAQCLSVAEIDKLADSLKASSADDKNTWFVCFKAGYIPFIHKVEGCRQILSSVIEEYTKDNLDAYSKFDAYKRISSMIAIHKDGIVKNLEKISANAAKFGATSSEVKGLNSEIENIKRIDTVLYKDIKDVPEIKSFIARKNSQIVEVLASKGINAENEYLKAKALISQKNYVDALNTLLPLKGYSDVNTLIEKLDKYYLISSVLEIEGNLYYFKKISSDYGTLNLYPTVEGKISDKPIIKGIGKIITNYADILYYIDDNDKLKKYNLSTEAEEKIYEKRLDKKSIYIHNRKAFLVSEDGGEYDSKKRNVLELDLTTGTIRTILVEVKKIISLWGNKLVYMVSEKNGDNEYNSNYKVLTKVINVDTMNTVELGRDDVFVESIVGDNVVYTRKMPNDYNRNLYVRDIGTDGTEKLIEQNIFKFCDIIADKLFYYVGNSKNQTLINIGFDCSGRKEWPLYISKILFEQGGWLYFIRKAGYNSVLCKARIDGSGFSIIAADIEEFVSIKNGYLYYINDVATLVKVRMDGSNLQELCEDVETVLSVKEDKIIFVSVDDRISTSSYEHTTTRLVKSIYAVDFSGSGKIKLAYNIESANEYDENSVYYIAAKEVETYNQSNECLNELYKLDVESNMVEKLLTLVVKKEEGGSSGFSIAITALFISIFFACIGFVTEMYALSVISVLVAMTSALIALALKLDKTK